MTPRNVATSVGVPPNEVLNRYGKNEENGPPEEDDGWPAAAWQRLDRESRAAVRVIIERLAGERLE